MTLFRKAHSPSHQLPPVNGEELLRAVDLHAGYGSVSVVHGINLHVRAGEMVALLGANGAGKTTTMSALAGVIPLSSGKVLLRGEATRAPIHKRVSAGLAFVPEERSVFLKLSVADNLRIGRGDVEVALERFPELSPLLSRTAGLLSGGQQQILTVARALSRRPNLLIADELAVGLAPLMARRLLLALREVADSLGIGILLVDQQARRALQFVDRAYVLRRGRLVLEGTAEELRGRFAEIESSYLSSMAVEAE